MTIRNKYKSYCGRCWVHGFSSHVATNSPCSWMVSLGFLCYCSNSRIMKFVRQSSRGYGRCIHILNAHWPNSTPLFSHWLNTVYDNVGNFCRPFLIFDPSTFTTAWFNTSPTPFYTKKKLLFKEKVTLINVVKIDTLKSNVILKRNDDWNLWIN